MGLQERRNKSVALYHCSQYLIKPVFTDRITNNVVTACSTLGRVLELQYSVTLSSTTYK
jgi:hypothetical protein